jgi:hypothetical protein
MTLCVLVFVLMVVWWICGGVFGVVGGAWCGWWVLDVVLVVGWV